MREIRLPDNVNRILAQLRAAGHEAYAVGGCVRDSLLGREPDDWDITTSARPEQVKALFSRTVDTGLKHGTVTVLLGGEGYEVTTYRVDGVYSDGRHPDSVTFTADLAEDLCRRDFTINAMAYSPEGGLVDLFGGQQDLETGVVRAVGDPVRRFSEDALRMMRAVRFAAQLGYTVEADTLAAAGELSGTLRKVSPERIRVEMDKLLTSPHPGMFRLLWETGLTRVFLPEWDLCMETPQNNPHHLYSVGEHILHCLEAVRADRILRLTMLFHDIGKPQCRSTDEQGVDHFYGHQEVSAQLTDSRMRALRYDNATRERVVRLVRLHDLKITETPAGVRRAAASLGEELFPLLLEVKAADVAAQSGFQREDKEASLSRIREIYAEVLAKGDCVQLKDLAVNGRDLMEAGIPAGPGLGRILQMLLRDVQEEPGRNERAYLLERALNSHFFNEDAER